MLLCLWIFIYVILNYSQARSFHNVKRQTISSQNVSATCITPNNQNGKCVSLRNCQPLFELLKSYKENRNQSTSDYLRRSQCGRIDPKTGYPKVCCIQSPNSEHSYCGLSSRLPDKITSILGGQSASLGSWPWIASLYYKTDSDPKLTPRCEGSLISKDWVVTAAHCLGDTTFILSMVRLGDLNLNDDIDDGATPVDAFVDEMIVHPQYFPRPVTNDVALIRLKTPVSFSTNVRPICLIKGTDEFKNDTFYSGRAPFVAGFGKHLEKGNLEKGNLSTALQEANVEMIDNDKCAKNYYGYNAVIDNRVLCAGGPTKDSCQGSSGGPLALQIGNLWYLIGVVSFGVGCGYPDFPGVYMRVAEFSDWISDVTGISS